ncbi:glycoside hydrolase family 9 protein [Paracnuella aquatica]|uniref:glycoside hydrolase family 9 protein n=1 Tax=Paracnuella aquatica TaxID=2268757 RepID=UPI000DF01DF0|nr:glycoside hydrolase family 9 protein [Paracnuella aquatica]RPD50697.1 cellulase [Paracnuella aquatica]
MNNELVILRRLLPVAAIFLLHSHTATAQMVSDSICLNQIGYYPNAPKAAMVKGKQSEAAFYITSTNLRDTFFRGKLETEKASAYSSTITRKADFSALNKPGSYVLLVPGLGHSYVFRIAPAVHAEVAGASLKGFYFQRMSMPLQPQFAGKWHRGAGHPDTEVLVHPSAASAARPAGTRLSMPGGWYDAGDYNKYVVNSGITTATLLSAATDYQQYFAQQKLAIPESGNALPDIIDEALYNLRWMLQMQDPNDGGVYHKCTNAAFDAMVMPGITIAPRYVVQKSTAAALNLAAVAAQAARVLQPYAKQVPGLRDTCLAVAKRAWAWSVQNPNVLYNQDSMNKLHKPEVTTGAYGDRNLADEWFWAATELLATTGDATYLNEVRQRMPSAMTLPSWNSVAALGWYTLAKATKLPAAATDLSAMAKQQIIQYADGLFPAMERSAFGTVMGQSVRDFIWGSSAVAANQGIALLHAYRFTGNTKYCDAALTNLDYLLGRNATGYSFVTGHGSKTPMHPHHRPSVADGIVEPVPGLLSGGPNPGRQDKCTTYKFTEPETAFTDDDCSYASNEIAINWNAPLVYLASGLEAVMK